MIRIRHLAGLALCILPLLGHAGKAHVHGIAKLDVAIEAGKITLDFESPLDNQLGFERAPRTDAERRQADAMVARLKAADTLFRIDPAAGCKLAGVELASSALQLGQPDPSEAGHADIDATFTFQCADVSKASYIDVGLFEYKRLKRLDVQIAAPRGQFKRELRPSAARLTLTP